MTRVNFIQTYLPLVRELGGKIKVYPETVFAQAFIEGGNSKGTFGESYAMKHGNNIFNIKPGTGWKGRTVANPNVKSESNVFRAYDSLEDSFKDYFNFLVKNKRYRNAGFFDARDYKEQADALQRAGYAGKDTKYAALIKKVGATVTDAINKFKGIVTKSVTVVKENKGSAAMIAGGVILAAGLYYYSKNGKG